jgi:hypothetical protein
MMLEIGCNDKYRNGGNNGYDSPNDDYTKGKILVPTITNHYQSSSPFRQLLFYHCGHV